MNNLNSPLSFSKKNAAQAQFDLYIKSREISQITQHLQHLEFVGLEARDAWIRDNEEIIEEMLNQFMDDSVSILENQTLDGETLNLSMDLIRNLRETSEILQSLMYDMQD